MTTTINASTSSGLVQTADTSGILQLQTANTAALTINASQNVGVGTASPTEKLTVVGGNSTQFTIDNTGQQYTSMFLKNNGTTKATLYWDNTNAIYNIAAQAASSQLALWTANSERMRIDSSGNVGIGVNSPKSALHVNGPVTLSSNYMTYLVNSYYDGAWKYVENGLAWGIGNNFNGPTNGVTIATAPVNAGGANAALTWTPRFGIDSSGNILQVSAAGLGYGTGSGGTVTQSTSRTTAVTLNKPTGAITMFTAAGSATWARFVLNNSLITANDLVICQVNGAPSNNYQVFANGCTAGSCWINFVSISGTASDTPVINFAIIKGATS